MKRLFTLFIAVLLIFAFAGPASADFKDMWADVYSWDGSMNGNGTMKLTRIESGITFKVLRKDADTAETLYEYNDDTLTSLTNPVSTSDFTSATVCNDKVAFKVDPTDSGDAAVDLIVVNTAGGYTVLVEDFDQYTHNIVIDERPNIQHHGIIWFAFNAGGTEVDTGIDFDYDTQVHDVLVEIVTVDAGETIDVGILASGTNGDLDGFRDGVALDTAGYPTDTAVITGGSNIDYVPVTTYGALLVTAITGTDAVVSNGGKSYIGHTVLSANEQSLTYTPSSSDTAAGYVHYFFTRMR